MLYRQQSEYVNHAKKGLCRLAGPDPSMRLAILTALTAGLTWAQSATPPNVLQRYLQARHDLSLQAPPSARETSGDERQQGVEVEIEASLPRMKKHGSMRGWRGITRAGQVVYSGLRFSGDRLIGKDVISRYLSADVQQTVEGPDVAMTDRNYRFQLARPTSYNGRVAVVYRVFPKHKRAGLFRGELWLDAATALPLREWGNFVKSPSKFLSHPRFVRDYNLFENRSQPRRMILSAHASFVGDVEMTIWFSAEEVRGALDKQVDEQADNGASATGIVAAYQP